MFLRPSSFREKNSDATSSRRAEHIFTLKTMTAEVYDFTACDTNRIWPLDRDEPCCHWPQLPSSTLGSAVGLFCNEELFQGMYVY